jgi:Glycosyl hydrolase family 79, N-terminal domain
MDVDKKKEAYAGSGGNWPRRSFLKRVTAGAAAIACSRWLRAQEHPATLHVSGTVIGAMPEGFTGLSYESSQLCNPSFFSSNNSALINLFRTLGSRGVLRLGGNSSDLTSWQSAGIDKPRASNSPVATQNEFSITPKAIENLADFLKTTNWQLIYGLNLAGGDPASAVEEAAYVARTAGERVSAFQFGNEPDMAAQSEDKTRRWTYEEYIAKWKLYYNTIRARLPAARIAGPDTAYKHDWTARFASDTTGEITLLTTHYYAEGPPSDPRMTIDYLLHTSKRFEGQILPDIRTARQSRVAYRLTESNTCYSGGKAGVSNTFASALWVIDFMLSLAAAGGSGVNLHGGGDGLYTPIAGSMGRGFSARPIYYGMLVARQFLGANLLAIDLDSGGSDLKAYASSAASGLRVVVINREAMPVLVQLRVQNLGGRRAGNVWRLEAPSTSSTTGITLADASVSPDGLFTPSRGEALAFHHGESALHLNPYSAALVVVNGVG